MWRVNWHRLPTRLPRLAIAALALTLVLSFVVALVGLGSMIRSTTRGLIAATAADITVVPTGSLSGSNIVSEPPVLDEGIVSTIESLRGVMSVAGRVHGGDIFPVSAAGELLRSHLAPTMTGSYVTAQDEESVALTITEGRAPTGEAEVVVDASTLQRSGHALGETMVFARPGPRDAISASIVGVTAPDTGDSVGATFALFSEATARAAFLGGQDGYNSTWVDVDEEADVAALVDQIAELLPSDFMAVPAAEYSSATRFQLYPRLGITEIITWVLIVALLVAAVAVVAGPMRDLMGVQRRDITLLRRAGAGRGALQSLLVVDALLVGLVGSLLALPVGLWLAGTINDAGRARGLSLGGAVPELGLPAVVGIVVAGLAVALIAARTPARSLLRTAGGLAPRPVRPPRFSFGDAAWTGLGLVVVGIALLIAVDRVESMPSPFTWALIGAGAVIVGAVAAVPVIAYPIVAVVSALVRLVDRLVGTLVPRHLMRRPGRFARATTALVLGTALVAALSVLSTTARASAEEDIPKALDADLVVTSAAPGGFARSFSATIAETPGVAAVASIGEHAALLGERAGTVTFMDPDTLEDMLAVEVEGRLPTRAGEALVDSRYAAAHQVTLRSNQPITINQESADVRVIGVLHAPRGFALGDFILPRVALADYEATDNDTLVAIDLAPGADQAQTREALDGVLAADPVLDLATPSELAGVRGRQLDAAAEGLDLLWNTVLLVSILAIGYVMSLAVTDRRRETQGLLEIGMEPPQQFAATLTESLLMALVGALVGTAAGTMAGVGLHWGLRDAGFAVLAIDWGRLAGLVGLGLLAGLVAGLVPAAVAAGSTSRENV